jgi:hypothetical protein
MSRLLCHPGHRLPAVLFVVGLIVSAVWLAGSEPEPPHSASSFSEPPAQCQAIYRRCVAKHELARDLAEGRLEVEVEVAHFAAWNASWPVQPLSDDQLLPGEAKDVGLCRQILTCVRVATEGQHDQTQVVCRVERELKAYLQRRGLVARAPLQHGNYKGQDSE